MASKIFPVAPFPAVVNQRAQASARRLQLDRIPLYQVHQPNPVVPDSVIMPGMRELLDGGKIGAAGVSNYSLARWRKADAALGRPVVSNQVHFSLAHPGALDDLVPFAERENRGVIAYSPLAPSPAKTKSCGSAGRRVAPRTAPDPLAFRLRPKVLCRKVIPRSPATRDRHRGLGVLDAGRSPAGDRG
ncbi:putative oxidoreductase [Mycobacterium persicum]|uniref:Oxidoreductase n=1 Tax=Mycobacterium persicum TaxID=1487726 RepID=A0AB38UVF2_9MYCO|nr:putative oxidoreductase [Mycobacterium persicum]